MKIGKQKNGRGRGSVAVICVRAGLFGGSFGGSLGGGLGLVDRGGGEGGLLVGGDVFDLVGYVNAGAIGTGGEGCHHGDNDDESHEAPGYLFEDVGRLTDAEGLVSCYEVAGQSAAFAVLEENNDNKEYGSYDHEHCQGCE